MKITLPMPSEKQKAFILDKHKFLAYGGSRGGGKSFGIREKCIKYALDYPKSKQLVLRRTYPELYNNHINPLKDWLFGVARYNESQKMFSFPNGSTIQFGYCDNDNDVRRYQGQEVDVLYIDEATQFFEEWFTKLTACVRGTNDYPKQIVLTMNPGGVGHHWVKRLFIDRRYNSTEKPENYRFIQSSVYDNKALLHDNPDYLEQLEALPERLRKAWLEGRWDVFEGSMFAEFRDDPQHYKDRRWTHVIEPLDEIPSDWKIYRAYDHGYRKPFACTYFAVDYDGCAYNFYEFYGWTGEDDVGKAWNTDHIFEEIKKLETQHPLLKGRHIIGIADPAIWGTQTGESVADTAAKHGIFFSPGDNERIAGWMMLHNYLAFSKDGYPQMYFCKNCENIIRTLPLLQYSETKVEDADTDMEDHLCLRGDTQVLTSEGYKPIESLVGTEGYVMSHDGKYHRYHDVRMTQKDAELTELTLEDGTKIYCTDDHRFMLPNGEWKRAGDLSAGEELMTYGSNQNQRTVSVAVTTESTTRLGEDMKIVEKRKVNKADVFNMVVDDTHTFVIQGGVVTHNCDACRYFVMSRPIKARKSFAPDDFDTSILHTVFDFRREDFR